MTLGERLLLLRRTQKMKQKDLARKAELTAATISAIENDIRQPNLPTFIRICASLNIGLDEFMEGVDL